MAYQTGTLANLNDALRTLKAFLVAQGWTVHVDYREPMVISHHTDLVPPPPHEVYVWRWAQRLALSKGTKFLSLQDFYLTHDLSYGTAGGSFSINGPGIAAVLGTASSTVVDPTDEAYWSDPSRHPAWYRHYTLAGDGVTPIFATDGTGPSNPDSSPPNWAGNVVNPSPIMIMPLPAVTKQEAGTWSPADGNFVNADFSSGPPTWHAADVDLWAPFGPVPGGAGVPVPYWILSDATGDNWIFVVQHDNTITSKASYLGVGTLIKAGDWVGSGDFITAARSNLNAFNGGDPGGHGVNRWAPPASIADDGGITFAVRMPAVDSSPLSWQGIGNGARRIFSTAENFIQQGTGPNGTKSGLGYGGLRLQKSSLVDGAAGLPLYLTIQRDSGLQSMIGSVPRIFQANTFGFPMGFETQSADGTHYIVFDGFIVEKTP